MNSDNKGQIQALLTEALSALAGVYSLGTRDVRNEIEHAFTMLTQDNCEMLTKYIQRALASSSFMRPEAPSALRERLVAALVKASREHAAAIVRYAEEQAQALGLEI